MSAYVSTWKLRNKCDNEIQSGNFVFMFPFNGALNIGMC